MVFHTFCFGLSSKIDADPDTVPDPAYHFDADPEPGQ